MNIKLILAFIAIFLGLVGCNSKVTEIDPNSAPAAESTIQKVECVGVECAVCQLPWGGTLGADQTLESVYTSELIACDDSCDKHKAKLTCKSGKLFSLDEQGTQKELDLTDKLFRSCFKRKCDCSHAGLVVEDGSQQNFFSAAKVNCGNSCAPKAILCKEGKLIDPVKPEDSSFLTKFTATSCTVDACPKCTTPWGEKVDQGAKVQAYHIDKAACGQQCSQPVTLTCANGSFGALANTYKFKSCAVNPCKDCSLPTGEKLAHNSWNWVHKLSEAPCEQSCMSYAAYLRCIDGTISGGDTSVYKHLSCSVKKDCARCTLPCGKSVVSGGSDFCFSAAKPNSCGETCVAFRKEFKCQNGKTLYEDGVTPISEADKTAYKTYSCSNTAACSSCPMPDGRSAMDSTKVIFYKNAKVACDKSCFGADNSVSLTCSNGTFGNQSLYKDFKFLECRSDCISNNVGDLQQGRIEGEGGGAPRSLCSLPWKAGMVTHDTEIIAYSRMTAPKGSSCQNYKAVIRCNGFKGLWTGGAKFIYPSCVEDK